MSTQDLGQTLQLLLDIIQTETGWQLTTGRVELRTATLRSLLVASQAELKAFEFVSATHELVGNAGSLYPKNGRPKAIADKASLNPSQPTSFSADCGDSGKPAVQFAVAPCGFSEKLTLESFNFCSNNFQTLPTIQLSMAKLASGSTTPLPQCRWSGRFLIVALAILQPRRSC